MEDEYTREPEETTSEDDQRKRLEALAESLLKKRDEAVLFRAASGVERRWKEDQEVYDRFDDNSGGGDMVDYATGDAYTKGSSGPVRSRVIVNIIRGKCETAEGRFADILLPVDDRNWGFRPTPVPDLIKGLTDDRPVTNTQTGETMVDDSGNPVRASDIAVVQMETAKTKMRAMESEVDDQLTECGFNGECRKVIKDAVKLGTGVLKGPNVVKQVRKSWIPQKDQGGTEVHILETVEEQQPASKRVDIWNCFPDPNCGEDISKASYIFEYDEILPRGLRSLLGVEGYFEDQIMAVLSEEPQRVSVSNPGDKGVKINKTSIGKGNAYDKWEYYGDVDRDDLEALGCDCEELRGQSLSACVVFVNERPIKIQLNVLDTGDIPYDFFQWSQVTGSPWGIGVPREGVWQQRIIIAAWRAMMDNARDSAGANIIFGEGVEPVDGKWELTGKKAWMANGEVDDVSKMFAQFQIQNNQKDLQAIIELAMRFLDLETNLPLLFQGEKEDIPDTLGATNIMVDSSNVALRTRVKIWDDQITRPHITRYYHWNMQYNENPEVKGDFNVDARGTSVLLARDQQSKILANTLQIKGDPRVDNEVDWGKVVRELFTALRLNNVLKSDEDKKKDAEKQKEQPQKADPSTQVAKIRTQGELQKAQLVQQSDMAELEFKAQEAERQRQHDKEMKSLDYQIKMMEFSQQSGMKLNDIKADLAKEASKQNLMRDLADKKTAQLTPPPIEPPQRAPAGEAFQQ
uniref:Putative portal protein n=1 Tax=viral metagenome TaxID=1070528 RepID=A0A6M3K659_9ZZZZ